MKHKIAETENIIVYKKGDIEIGYEPETALDLIVEGLIGAKSFARHLAEPISFWGDFKKDILDLIEGVEREILKK